MISTAQELLSYFENAGLWKSYSIAFSLRCGSTVLSNALASRGCGRPTEYFQYPYSSNYFRSDDAEKSVADQFCLLVMDYMQGGIFGSKMTHDHRAHLDAHLRKCLDNYRSLNDVLPEHKWIFIKRKDIIAQAISWHVAETSKIWHVSSNDGPFMHDHISYDFFSILSKVMIISANNLNWDTYFSLMKITPHRIFFEDILFDINGQLSGIYEILEIDRNYLDVTLEREGGLLSIAKGSKAIYESLKGRFIGDFIRIGEADDRLRLGPSLEKWRKFFFESQWR